MTREEAIEVVRKNLPHLGIGATEMTDALGTLIPELAETEDERILRVISEAVITFFSDYANDFEDEDRDAALAYLEKQKEQKQEWSEEDKEKIVTISEIIEHCTTIPYSGGTLTLNKEYKKELLCFIKSLRPSWKPSEDELTKKHLEGYIKGRNDALREMSDFMESHFNTNKAKEDEDLTDLYYKEFVRNPQPIPSGWGCDGIHCTNPQMDCINCPRKTTGGSFSTSSASGTSAATLHGNTSATDGKPHNPSFTD